MAPSRFGLAGTPQWCDRHRPHTTVRKRSAGWGGVRWWSSLRPAVDLGGGFDYRSRALASSIVAQWPLIDLDGRLSTNPPMSMLPSLN
jgi:hypothetical protein